MTVSDSWSKPLDNYATAQQAAGKSPGTIRLHRHYLSRLREVHRTPWNVTTAQLQQFLSNQGWAPETRKSARSVVRGFYRWAHLAGRLESDPAAALDPVRVPGGVPRPAPETLLRQLERHPDNRVAFMVLLAGYAGLRAGEIARLHADDYVGDELLVKGKGGKTRAVPILHQQLHWRLVALDGWAFPNGYGSHLTPGHVSRLLSREMPAGWTAHTLRHRCATVAYAGTRDLLAVGALLGHSRPETTQRYVRVPDDAVRAAARSALAS